MRRTFTAAVATAALTIGLVAPAAARPDGAGPPEADGTIVDTAAAVNAATGEFSTLLFLVDHFDLTATLDGRRQFTVFAPTDAAFADLFADLGTTPGALLSTPEGEQAVLDILLYHVAPGERFSDDVAASTQVTTLNGARIPIEDDGTLIDEANLVPGLFDVDVSNGVIHTVDAVLLP